MKLVELPITLRTSLLLRKFKIPLVRRTKPLLVRKIEIYNSTPEPWERKPHTLDDLSQVGAFVV